MNYDNYSISKLLKQDSELQHDERGIRKRVGFNIRYFRLQKGFTLSELAEAIGIKKPTLRQWEEGGGFPSGENTAKLCEIFKISLDTLINNDHTPSSDEVLRNLALHVYSVTYEALNSLNNSSSPRDTPGFFLDKYLSYVESDLHVLHELCSMYLDCDLFDKRTANSAERPLVIKLRNLSDTNKET